jgi:hypothetical protein
MSTPLTAQDARTSLTDHVAAKGLEIRQKYGPHIGWPQLQLLLADRSCVRYPCELVFAAGFLSAGEIAHHVGNSERPEDGFKLYLHPFLLTRREQAVYWILYQLVVVNYGEFASPNDAEVFGAAALGLAQEEYYEALCRMADEMGGSGCGAA